MATQEKPQKETFLSVYREPVYSFSVESVLNSAPPSYSVVAVVYPKTEDDFLEDLELAKNPEILKASKEASKQSLAGQSRPMNELYEKYGI